MNETTKGSGKPLIFNARGRAAHLLKYTDPKYTDPKKWSHFNDATRLQVRAVCKDLERALETVERGIALVGKPWSAGGWCMYCYAGTGAAAGIKGEHTPNCKFVAFHNAYDELFKAKSDEEAAE